MANDSIFAFACIWDSWQSPDGGRVETFSIVTNKPNSLLASVHDRMPVILPEPAYDLWLDLSFQQTHALCDMLQPFDASRMRGYAVSSGMNSVRNDNPACAPTWLNIGATAEVRMPGEQGSLGLLQHPAVKQLLQTTIPARLAYVWMDGTPRVTPIWFHWNEREFVLATPPKAPNLRAGEESQGGTYD